MARVQQSGREPVLGRLLEAFCQPPPRSAREGPYPLLCWRSRPDLCESCESETKAVLTLPALSHRITSGSSG